MSAIIIDGNSREINRETLLTLTKQYLPEINRENFVRDIIFRMADLEIDSSMLNGVSAEEYYFAACLAYVQDHDIGDFIAEDDDTKIFDYCGVQLNNLSPVQAQNEPEDELELD